MRLRRLILICAALGATVATSLAAQQPQRPPPNPAGGGAPMPQSSGLPGLAVYLRNDSAVRLTFTVWSNACRHATETYLDPSRWTTFNCAQALGTDLWHIEIVTRPTDGSPPITRSFDLQPGERYKLDVDQNSRTWSVFSLNPAMEPD